MLARLVMICSVFGRIANSVFKNLQEWYGQNIYAVRIAVNRWFSTARPAFNMLCQDKACRRGRLEASGAGGTNGGHAVDGGSKL